MAKLSAEEIRNRFGFSYNEDHAANGGNYSDYGGRDDGAIYSTTDGTYIGTINDFTPREGPKYKGSASGIDSFKSVQNYELENGYRGEARQDWDSMNDVAGAVQNIYGTNEKAAPEQAPQAKPPVVLSDRAAQAVAGTKAYENVMLPRQGDYTIKNDQSVVSDFENAFKLNLARAKAPQPQDVSPADTKQAETMEYANNYKKAVADTLVPDKISFATSGMQPGQAGQRGLQFS